LFVLFGCWGLGMGDWGLGIRPNPQSPIPNPQSPIPNPHFLKENIHFYNKLNKFKFNSKNKNILKMIFNSFWKKIFILNIVLLLVIYRLFTVLEKYIKQNTYNNSLFPILTENGYPFFDSINCDVRSLISITKKLIDNYAPNISFQNDLMTSKECSFISKYTLCKDNKQCLSKIDKSRSEINSIKSFDVNSLNNLYHFELNDYKIKNTISINSLFNIINNKNEFMDTNSKSNVNKIEVQFYNKIMSGYYSFLSIKQYDNNIKSNSHMGDNDYYNYNILKQITQYENKINDLFYFHSLILNCFIKLENFDKNENSTEFNDLNIILNYANQCIDLSDDQFYLSKNKILPKNTKLFENIFFNEIMGLIDCIPDAYERTSFLIDFTAINTIIKLLSYENVRNISLFEFNSLKFLLIELSKRINDIFNCEILLKNKVNLLKQNFIYIIIIYGFSSIALIFFINRHFIKNKNKYEKRMKRREYRPQNNYNLNQNGIKNDRNEKKLTEEELNYIQKLAKENKGDFLIAK